MLDGSWFNWRRLMTALQALLPTRVQPMPAPALALMQQAATAGSLRQLLAVAHLAQLLPWKRLSHRRAVMAAVLERLGRLPRMPPASPRSSSSRRKRGKSTTRPRR